MIALLARVRFDMAQDIERRLNQLREEMKCLHAGGGQVTRRIYAVRLGSKG